MQRTLSDFTERLIDSAEAALWKGVLDRDSWAVKLALETHGRRRGYGDGPDRPDFLAQSGRVTIQEVLAVLLENDAYLEFCRAQHGPAAQDELAVPAGAD